MPLSSLPQIGLILWKRCLRVADSRRYMNPFICLAFENTVSIGL